MITSLVAAVIERDVVRATGADTIAFLDGQLSQDIAALPEGESAWSLLLEPQGKVVALVRVTRMGPDDALLDVDPGWGDAVVGRLERFKLRTACHLTLVRWPAVAYRGDGASAVDVEAPIVARAGWSGTDAIDVVGPGVEPVDGVALVDHDELTRRRILAGWPAMGSELDSSTIPAAAGIVDEAVSFTKGCYTGQELVARIDSRGSNTPTRLVGLRLAEDALAQVGASMVHGGEDVGRVTSAAEGVALGYLRRAVDVGVTVTVTASSGAVEATTTLLPFS